MRGQRVLVSGMGGELGSLVAALLEEQPWVGSIRGIDIDPPRRRLRRAEFELVDPTDWARTDGLVESFNPHVIMHLGVYEPDARASSGQAAEWTATGTAAVMDAAQSCNALRAIVVRSGFEVYGRGGGRVDTPTEAALVAPTSAFGRSLAEVEAAAAQVGIERRIPVAVARLATVMGGHVPSPLGRLLRAPIVPVHLNGTKPFRVIGTRDAATALVAAAARRFAGSVNVGGSGTTTPIAAVRRGGRIPMPIVGPQWRLARPVFRLQGMPIPEHVIELLTHGRSADVSRAAELLGVSPVWTTEMVIEGLYDWEAVIRSRPSERSESYTPAGARAPAGAKAAAR